MVDVLIVYDRIDYRCQSIVICFSRGFTSDLYRCHDIDLVRLQERDVHLVHPDCGKNEHDETGYHRSDDPLSQCYLYRFTISHAPSPLNVVAELLCFRVLCFPI